MLLTEEDRRLLQDLLKELKRGNDLREEDLRQKWKEQSSARRRRRQPDGWFAADQTLDKLYPLITETHGLKILRERGLFGKPDEGYKQQGRAYFYNPKAIDKLRRQYEAGQLQQVRRDRNK